MLVGQGATGPSGATGAAGSIGPTGPQGTAGATGAQGDQGTPGDVGPQGLQGVAGPVGATGPSGTLPAGVTVGAMLYWNGSEWIEVAVPPKTSDVTLRLCAGVPTWANQCPKTVVSVSFGDIGPAGGKIFYVAPDHSFALEAAPDNQNVSPWGQGWGCTNTIVGTTNTSIGTGAANTASILANGCAGPGSAVALAKAYTLNGYSDWYLPSRDELEVLRDNKALVGNWFNCFYYSSSEDPEPTNPLAIWVTGVNVGDPRYWWWRLSASNECVGVRAVRTIGITNGPFNSLTIDVSAAAEPWIQNINPAFQVAGDQSVGPVVVTLQDKGLTAGRSIQVACLGGVTNVGGCDGSISLGPINNNRKDGMLFPSAYISAADYPALIEQVIGVFTDSQGIIVGMPFLVRTTPRQVFVPAGATQIQFGSNDSLYDWDHNSGSLSVQMSW